MHRWRRPGDGATHALSPAASLQIRRLFSQDGLGATVLLAISLAAPWSAGQTNDPVFRSWRWEEEIVAPRAGGLGGAFVGLADDVSSVVLNPAGMTTLWAVGEGQFGWNGRRAGTAPLGDGLRRSGHFLGGAAVRPKNFFAVGFYSYYPRSVRPCLGPCGAPGEGPPGPLPGVDEKEAGRIDTAIVDVVLAASLRPRRFQWVSVGAALNVSWRIDDVHVRRYGPSGVLPEEHVPAVGPGHRAAFTTLGLLLLPSPGSSLRGFRVGLTWRPTVRWPTVRKTFDDSYDLTKELGRYDLVRPGLLSAGTSWSSTPRPKKLQWRISGQLDRVRYSDITRGLVLEPQRGSPTLAAADYRLDDGWEPRAGFEVGWKLVALRAGIHREAPGALEYVGPDAGERLLFSGSRARNRFTTGATVTFPWWKVRRLLNIDALMLWGGDQRVLTFATTFRYPVPY